MVQDRELRGEGDGEDPADPHGGHVQTVLPEQRHQRVEHAGDHPQEGEVHEDHRDERAVGQQLPDPFHRPPDERPDAGRRGFLRRFGFDALALRLGWRAGDGPFDRGRVVDERHVQPAGDEQDHRVHEQRARQAPVPGDEPADGATRHDADVEGSVEHRERAGHVRLRHHLQQVAVQRGEQHRRPGAAGAPEHDGEREARGEPGEERGHADHHDAGGRRRPFAEPVHEGAGDQVEREPGDGERGDQEARHAVPHAEGSRVQREDRRHDPEPEHDHEDHQDDDANPWVRQDHPDRDAVGRRPPPLGADSAVSSLAAALGPAAAALGPALAAAALGRGLEVGRQALAGAGGDEPGLWRIRRRASGRVRVARHAGSFIVQAIGLDRLGEVRPETRSRRPPARSPPPRRGRTRSACSNPRRGPPAPAPGGRSVRRPRSAC